MKISDKRRQLNIKNMVKFLSTVDLRDEPRPNPFNELDLHTIIEFIKIYKEHRDALECIFAYVRKYRQASSELVVSDLYDVQRTLQVMEVHEVDSND